MITFSVQAIEPDWTVYNRLLHDYVKSGQRDGTALNAVNYSQLRHDVGFAQVVSQLEGFDTGQLQTQEEKLAFYINAYNIFALKTILDHWPIASIKDAGSFIYPVWYRDAGIINGRTVSLNEVEHKILRTMGEPRIHLAIVCASVSCPDLRPEAYTATQLNAQLDDQVKLFLHNPAKGLNINGNTVQVSQIFDWFGDDFKVMGGVEAFLRRYVELPETIHLKADLPYDWSLNGE